MCTPSSCDDGLWCNGAEFCAPSGECGDDTAPLCDGSTPACSNTLAACVECDTNADCVNPNPVCANYVCRPCLECLCVFGEHDGGDGVCVADGICADGYTLAYLDADHDGKVTAEEMKAARQAFRDGWKDRKGPPPPPAD